ncbi:MAG: bifunctional lysine ketoglutarate reductase /saccharopine dehydrogenase family protein [Desulfobacterales bacterium]
MKIGIRKEDKSVWERRVPFVPADIKELRENGIDMVVQSSPHRIFTDAEFAAQKVPVQNDLKDCDMIIGIKEIPPDLFEENRVYLFFAHVIKGQPRNMPMLKSMMEKKVTLIDYEKVVDAQKRRLIFFGRYAGLAGIINSFWALGQRLLLEGIASPFVRMQQAHHYHDLEDAKAVIREIRADIEKNGIPPAIHPLIVGLSGYGNVSKGAQELLDLFPVEEILPNMVSDAAGNPDRSDRQIYKAVFKEEHCVSPKDKNAVFSLQEYYRYGKEKYENSFSRYAEHLNLLLNCVYWDSRYPRLVTKEMCKNLWAGGKQPRLRVIGDISCDVEGAVECTVKTCDLEKPVYVYHPDTGKISYGFAGNGPVIMAVDILPSELPRESSVWFSNVLKEFAPSLAKADFARSFEELNLRPELKGAVILHHGELTPEYEYIRKFLEVS